MAKTQLTKNTTTGNWELTETNQGKHYTNTLQTAGKVIDGDIKIDIAVNDDYVIPAGTKAVNKTGDIYWERITWLDANGNSVIKPTGDRIWSDGTDIYYSDYNSQLHYKLNKNTGRWSRVHFYLTNAQEIYFNGFYVWSDGTNTYYSNGNEQYVLVSSENYIWDIKSWNINLDGEGIWHDGENIYYSMNKNHYVLDKVNSNWDIKNWNGISDVAILPLINFMWSDGTNIYISGIGTGTQYVLDRTTSTWNPKTWLGINNVSASAIWNYGNNVYCHSYVLDKSNSTWISKIWKGGIEPYGSYVWSDGTNTYYSHDDEQYILITDNLLEDVTSYKNAYVNEGSFNNVPNGETDYASFYNPEITVSANSYLYINAGYFPNVKLYLGNIIPTPGNGESNATSADVRSGKIAYTGGNGNKVVGSMDDVSPSFTGGTPSLADTSNTISTNMTTVSSSDYYIDASASAKATRIAVTYDNNYTGYLNKTNGTTALSAETSSAGTINASRVYIPAGSMTANSNNGSTKYLDATPGSFPYYANVNAGYFPTGRIKINAPSNLSAENIKSGVTIAGVTGSYSGPSYSTYDGTYNVS